MRIEENLRGGSRALRAAFGALLLICALQASTNAQLYCVSGNGAPGTEAQLHTIDAATADLDLVGSMGIRSGGAMAFDENSQTLYGYSSGPIGSDRSLVVIDLETAAATKIETSPHALVTGMAYDPNTDTLFATDFAARTLSTVDPATGSFTLIGSTEAFVGLAFDPIANVLYGTDRTSDLYTIDPASGTATRVGSTGFSEVQGLAFDRVTNTLFGTSNLAFELVTIDVSTGSATLIGSLALSNGVGGLASVPAIGTIVDCGAGAVDAGCGSAADVLLVNGNAGGADRVVDTIDRDTPLSFELAEPPSRIGDGEPTRACVYVWLGEPGDGDTVALPQGLGTMCFGPFVSTTRTPRRIFNAIGLDGKLGAHDSPSPMPVIADGAVLEFARRPSGTGHSMFVTVQGIIEDDCSQGALPYSVTNGLVLRVF